MTERSWIPHANAVLTIEGRAPERVVLRPGCVIGRGDAHIVVSDPEVSEAHALVSRRAEGLVLLRLRGPLLLDGEDVDESPLRSGDRYLISPATRLEIESVRLPAEGLALRDSDGAILRIPARYASIAIAPLQESPTGSVETWVEGVRVMARLDGVTSELVPGMRIGELEIVLVEVPATARTLRTGPTLDCSGTIPVMRDGESSHTFRDLTGALLLGLAMEGDGAHWRTLAGRYLWRGIDPEKRRKHFEQALDRSQQELAAAGYEDLVRKTGPARYALNRARYRVLQG